MRKRERESMKILIYDTLDEAVSHTFLEEKKLFPCLPPNALFFFFVTGAGAGADDASVFSAA
jgi:hypothetical protein